MGRQETGKNSSWWKRPAGSDDWCWGISTKSHLFPRTFFFFLWSKSFKWLREWWYLFAPRFQVEISCLRRKVEAKTSFPWRRGRNPSQAQGLSRIPSKDPYHLGEGKGTPIPNQCWKQGRIWRHREEGQEHWESTTLEDQVHRACLRKGLDQDNRKCVHPHYKPTIE